MLVTVAVETVAQVGQQPFGALPQLVGADQLIVHDPAGQHLVADVVAEERVGRAEQIEKSGEQLRCRVSGRHLGIAGHD